MNNMRSYLLRLVNYLRTRNEKRKNIESTIRKHLNIVHWEDFLYAQVLFVFLFHFTPEIEHGIDFV